MKSFSSCKSLFKTGSLFGMVSYKTKALSTIYGLVDWWNHTLTHILPSSYQVLTNASSGWQPTAWL
jgi:hypothetical protein